MLTLFTSSSGAKTCISRNFKINIIIAATILSCLVFYWQYSFLKEQHIAELDEEVTSVRAQWDRSISAYDSMLSMIGRHIIDNKLFGSDRAVGSLLKKFSVNPRESGSKSTVIGFSDINWQRAGSDVVVHRHGISQKLPFDLKNGTQAVSDKLSLHFELNNDSINDNRLYITLDLFDRNKSLAYIGKLSATLDLPAWIRALNSDLHAGGHVVAIVDGNYEKGILFASEKDLLSAPKASSLYLHYGNFSFTHYDNLQPSDYEIVLGYSKPYFYSQLWSSTAPLMLVIWGAAIIFLIIQATYDVRLKRSIKTNFIAKIDVLTQDNKEQLLTNQRLTNEVDQLQQNSVESEHYYTDLEKAEKTGLKARQQLETLLGNRIAESVVEIREITRAMIDRQNESTSFATNYKKQIEVLEDLNSKLDYLSMFCVLRKSDQQIAPRDIIEDIFRIYAKEIFLLQLNIKIEINNRTNIIFFDELLLRQILANLLRLAIESARPSGEISIIAATKKNNDGNILIVTIIDNGFGVLQHDLENSYPISTLTLSSNALQGIVESFKGCLQTKCFAGKGNTIILSVPYSNPHIKKDPIIYGDNIVIFKKN